MNQPPMDPLDPTTMALLKPNAQLGPYRIEERVGAGGMGEVFRAVDVRLGRKVAIKVSSHQFDSRFEREARAISALNHPHICTLYDIGPNYLVMEFVEGESLAARLDRAKLSIEDTVRLGAQIADALAEAHAKGIVHRDLKPGNIMLARSGVKVLDFGLAKLELRPDETATASHMIMGTPAYMAPEQREGSATDARTDIYALGLVLYEMSTGKRATPGQPLSVAELPPGLAHVIERCVALNPEARWQSARDVGAELQWAGQRPAASTVVAPAPKSRRWTMAALAAAVAAAAAAAFIPRGPSGTSASAQPFSFRIPIPDGRRMVGRSTFAISPDGKALAFLAARSDGIEHVWVHRIGELDARPLQDTESAVQSPSPIWSPDSKTLVFYSDRKLKKINVSGGAPEVLCDVSSYASGGSWSRDNVIIFGDLTRGIMRVPAAGGTPVPLTKVNQNEGVQTFPVFLPDGHHFLYAKSGGSDGSDGTYLGSIDQEPGKQDQRRWLASPQTVQIVQAAGKVKLLYLRSGTLLAQDFDPSKLQLTGEAEMVAERVGNSLVFGFYAASPAALAYRTVVVQNIQLRWIDRQGTPGQALGEPITNESSLAISPDGQRALVSRLELKNNDLWGLDLKREMFVRITSSAALDFSPVWSRDSRSFAYASNTQGAMDLMRGTVDGDLKEELLLHSNEDKYPWSWSADGASLLYSSRGPTTRDDLWILPFDRGKPGTPVAFANSAAWESEGAFSPDGRWIAYTSDETGSNEIYVRPLAAPASGGASKVRVSTAGGRRPRWRGDGKELFYAAPDGRMMAVSTGSGNSFQASVPQALFAMHSQVWDVAPDGKRFLMGVPVEQGGQVPFTVVMNWMAGLKH